MISHENVSTFGFGMVSIKRLANQIFRVQTFVRLEILKFLFRLVNFKQGHISFMLVLHGMRPRTNDKFFEFMDIIV